MKKSPVRSRNASFRESGQGPTIVYAAGVTVAYFKKFDKEGKLFTCKCVLLVPVASYSTPLWEIAMPEKPVTDIQLEKAIEVMKGKFNN